MTTSETGVREEILATAMRMFIQQGYHGLAMRQISEAVGVSKAALYYYFKDKEELFLAILNAYLNEIEASIDAIRAGAGSSTDQLRQFVESVLGQPAEQRAIIRLASQEMSQLSAVSRRQFDKLYREKFIGKLTAILQEGMERGEFRTFDAEVATWSLLGIMYPYFYPAHSSRPLAPETIQEIVNIYLNGVTR
ncbi:MAG: TetR/AcrR family transcriptional regulator [Chloroflexi bacterium]|nr:TetR/AcrR family transcriptional regulator [Chloroflexota bacterium]